MTGQFSMILAQKLEALFPGSSWHCAFTQDWFSGGLKGWRLGFHSAGKNARESSRCQTEQILSQAEWALEGCFVDSQVVVRAGEPYGDCVAGADGIYLEMLVIAD